MRSILNFLKYHIFADGYVEPGIQIIDRKYIDIWQMIILLRNLLNEQTQQA